MSVQRARALRRRLTRAESILWRHLRSRQLGGWKWRRQEPLGAYVVDFLCPELRLAVEVDGDVHAFRELEDAERQASLEAMGLRVVRFTNDDVIRNIDGVLTALWTLCEDSKPY